MPPVATGVPYAVFIEPGNGNRAAVKKFDGSDWVYVGTPGISTGNASSVMINPVTSEANLTLTLDKVEPVQARIIDNMGNVVQVQHWNLGAGVTSISMDMSQLVKGMYYLEISSKSIKKQISLIKL